MLDDSQLIVEVRRLADKNRGLAVLLVLAHVQQPAKTAAIATKASDIGFRRIKEWNVTDILNGAADKSQVTKLPQGWRLLDPGTTALTAAGVNMAAPRQVIPSDSVLPRELFDTSRGYIKRVVSQINGSYDFGFFDCSAVMCRRLVETLVIEVYEREGRAAQLKGKDGHFMMLNGLLSVFLNDPAFNVGRNSVRGLEALKALGDKSAHTRSFNARKADIDQLRPDLRAAVEELLHLAKFI